ncbi:MAG: methyltransferase domain-containing protein [Candidatus Eiseniibacteriota bacterium]|nr:MAG: methyltransferase domain-containing protein [Candidatus Eisenbacteria bacterium]
MRNHIGLRIKGKSMISPNPSAGIAVRIVLPRCDFEPPPGSSAMTEPQSHQCPICGGSKVIAVGKPQVSPQAAPFVRSDYRVVMCLACRFYFVTPGISLSQQEWQRLYGDDYFEEMLPWWAEKKRRDRAWQLDWLQVHSDREVLRFLDVGCGRGEVLLEAASRGWSAYGVDISDNRTVKARGAGINFIKGNLFNASFEDGFFDSVYMNSVLEHVVDPLSLLREVKRILRTGGVLFFGVPNEDSLYNDARQLLFHLSGSGELSARLCPFKSPYHVSGFTRSSLKKALTEAGLDMARLKNFAGEYEWRRYRPFTRPFFVHFLMLPVHVLAIPMRKRLYFEVVARRND